MCAVPGETGLALAAEVGDRGKAGMPGPLGGVAASAGPRVSPSEAESPMRKSMEKFVQGRREALLSRGSTVTVVVAVSCMTGAATKLE